MCVSLGHWGRALAPLASSFAFKDASISNPLGLCTDFSSYLCSRLPQFTDFSSYWCVSLCHLGIAPTQPHATCMKKKKDSRSNPLIVGYFCRLCIQISAAIRTSWSVILALRPPSRMLFVLNKTSRSNPFFVRASPTLCGGLLLGFFYTIQVGYFCVSVY